MQANADRAHHAHPWTLSSLEGKKTARWICALPHRILLLQKASSFPTCSFEVWPQRVWNAIFFFRGRGVEAYLIVLGTIPNSALGVAPSGVSRFMHYQGSSLSLLNYPYIVWMCLISSIHHCGTKGHNQMSHVTCRAFSLLSISPLYSILTFGRLHHCPIGIL